MISRGWSAALAVVLWAATCWGTAAAETKEFVFTYLQKTDDPAYEFRRIYTGLALRSRYRPIDGAKTALRESKVLGRAAGVKFKLLIAEVGAAGDAIATIRAASRTTGSQTFILDVPLEDTRRAAKALASEKLLLFNPRHPDRSLRNEDCSAVMFHTLPSRAMMMDALSQFLTKKRWTKILVLQGEAEEDAQISDAFQRSARKFGLAVIDVRPFKLSNDPRHRDETNIVLLTGGSYDVVFLADSIGEFGRYVPYQTLLPRPVVGTEGLRSSAWHWTWERHGAPQLNQRFDKRAERRMQDADWAAWAAVKSVVEAVVRSKSTDFALIREHLISDSFILDSYKGTPSNFRPWNNQLRQPILLHVHNAVVARAPLAEYLHSINNLDTLGLDRQESVCRMK